MTEAERERAVMRYQQQAMIELDLRAHLLRQMKPGTWPADSEMGRRWRLIEDTKARANAFQEMARLDNKDTDNGRD